MTDLAKLKALAKAATAGPWIHGGTWVNTSRGNSVADCQRGDEKYIAAANPTAVLALIAENETLKDQVATLQGAENSWQSGYDEGRRMGTKTAYADREQLKAENEALRTALTDCAISLRGEMLQKFHGQTPDDMHPVTRREYDRDMAEVAEYRSLLGKGERS